MKKILIVILMIGVVAGGYYLVRLMPILTTDNSGAEKVVLLHGLGRTEVAMLILQSSLTEAGFDVYSFSYPSTDEPPDVLLEMVSDEINSCCIDSSETVHFVGHSLGGLLIRAYLGEHEVASLGNVVLLGTPNKGSELADVEPDESWPSALLERAGPTAQALRTGPEGFAASLSAPYYPVGIIAGTQDNPVANKWLPVPNDGLVSVESAKLDGMADFVAVDLSHWQLRNDPVIARQVIEFLLHGQFDSDT